MIVSIASGKGGTGKTTLSLLLAKMRENITIIDCDVEEPNCHLFFPYKNKEVITVETKIPFVEENLCNACGKCINRCLFNVIAMPNKVPVFFTELCHACGSCMLACPQKAILERSKEVGVIKKGKVDFEGEKQLWYGEINIGVVSGVPLIKKVKAMIEKEENNNFIIDCPPGTACSMVAAVRNTHACILVTEPTAFGLHDLKLAIEVTKHLKIPAGVVVNRSLGEKEEGGVLKLCQENKIPLIASLPYNFEFAKMYAQGNLTGDFFIKECADIWAWLESVGGEKIA